MLFEVGVTVLLMALFLHASFFGYLGPSSSPATNALAATENAKRFLLVHTILQPGLLATGLWWRQGKYRE